MSTKTSFKRIAAVAVLALGLGGFSAVSSHATVLGDNLAVSSTTVAGTINTASSVVVTQSFLTNAATANADTATVAAYLISAPTYSLATPSFDSTPANVAAVSSTAVSKNATQVDAGATSAAGNYSAGPIAVTAYSLLKFTPDLPGTYVIKVAQTLSSGSSSSSVQTVTITASAPAPVTTTSSRVYMQAGDSVSANGGALSLALDVNGYKAVPNDVSVSVATNKSAIIANVAIQDADTTTNLSTTSASSAYGALAGSAVPAATFGVVVGNGVDLAHSTITSAIQHVGGSYGPTGAFTAAGFPETISISGPGLISVPGIGVVGKSYTDASGQINYLQRQFSVFADGTSGVSTVTVSVNGVVIGTKTITFYGTPAKVTATAVHSVVKNSASIAANAVELFVTDKDGHAAPLQGSTLVGTSSNTAVISSSVASDCRASTVTAHVGSVGYFTCDVTTPAGIIASGSKADLTYALTAADTTVTATSNAVTIAADGSTIASLAITFGQDSYAPGDKVTATLTAKDSSGNVVADGAYGVFDDSLAAANGFAGFATSAQITSAVFAQVAGGVTFTNGVATGTFYAPYADGIVSLSATLPATNAHNGVATALVGTSVAGTFTVANPSSAAAQAAIDAAQEATDAANAAYDAANNAMDSADAATAAAQDASDNASAALAAVTSLSATVAKLVKSVTAIATALASIKKKLGVK